MLPLLWLRSVVQYDASKLEHTFAMAFGNAFEIEEVYLFPKNPRAQGLQSSSERNNRQRDF